MSGILNILMGVVGTAKDAFFNLVTLLLPGNGTNGAQNNTFLDSSTNNFTITRNGDTTQGTFSPFSQTGWGAYFDGTNDYVNNSTLNSTYTGDFTFEAWVYISSFPSNLHFFGQGSETTNRWLFGTTSAGRLFANPYGGSDIFFGSNGDVTAGSWLHIAFVRSGLGANNITGYVNGQSKGTGTSTATVGNSGGFGIGAGQNGSGPMSGYMSNVRYTAQALYTSNFTPSAVPLTTTSQGASSSNVKVLALQSNRFIDNAATPNTLTANNGVAITPFSPFAPTSPYTAAAVGGSGYFDGSGDYIVTTGGSAIAVGSGAFTLEGWLYLNSVNTDGAGFGSCAINADGSSDRGVSLFIQTGGSWRFRVGRSVAGQFEDFVGTTSLTTGQWYHFQLIRTSTGTNDTKSYLNGVLQATGTSTIGITMQKFSVGTYAPSDSSITLLNGYAAGVRLTNTALTSGTPTSPPTAVTGTAILLNFTNAGIYDATAKNDLQTVGDAQIDTSVSKFGGGSIKFDGTGDWLTVPDGPLFNLGTGDFTIEGWIYPTSSTVGTIVAKRANTATQSWLQLYYDLTNKIGLVVSFNGSTWGINSIGTINVPLNSWAYFALVRSGSSFKTYINGTQDISATDSGSIHSNTTAMTVGAGSVAGGQTLYGYIDDLRITRYARTITASPTAPFPLQ